MGLLQRLLGRKHDHAAWLEQHPGKESMSAPPPETSAAEEARMRGQMEQEMTDDRTRRDQR